MATVWFDAAAPAQAVWFAGLAPALRGAGHEVVVTCRPGTGTEAVTRLRVGEPAAVVEGHGRDGPAGKVTAIAGRARRLARWARGALGPGTVAVSHNSYAHLLAARWLRVPALTSMDYEWQPANHLAFRAATRVLLPDAYPLGVARRQGATARKRTTYPGLKEAVGLVALPVPAGTTRPAGRRLAVVRPEATYAAYGREQRLGDLVVERLVALGCEVMVLPREPRQAAELAARWGGLDEVSVVTEAVDGPALVARADVVVGAGGTMTREAALLGTPAYSTFAGRVPAVDLALERQGRLVRLTSPEAVSGIVLGPRRPPALDEMARTRAAVFDAVLGFCHGPH